MTGGSRCVVAVAPVASTSGPETAALARAISSIARSISAKARALAAIRVSPSRVGRAVLPMRSRSFGAELLLEQANVIADRGLRQAEHLGGGGEAAQPGHFAQRPKPFEAGKMARAWPHSFRNDLDQKQQFLK